jgi:hypothetical protein
MNARTTAIVIAAVGLLAPGCKKNKFYTDDPDVAAGYRDSNQYSEDIVTAQKRRDYDEQGTSISPGTLAAIEHTITTVYERDFERCLEVQMGESGTRFMRSAFTVEFHIDPSGRAGQAQILEITTRKQDAKGADLGEFPSDAMKSCIADSIAEWTFDPAPEVEYVHTYTGAVGEAF